VTAVAAAPAAAATRRQWLALTVVCMAMMMNVLDASIVNVALPDIQKDLNFTQANLAWIVDAYLITFGSFMLMAGRLGDLVGRRRVFLVGIAIFTVSSTVCALADGQVMLIAARFVQGLGSAVSASVIMALIVTEFPRPDERAKAMGAYVFVGVSGGAIGLLVGGLLTQLINWHWIFAINIPIGIATLVAGYALLDRDEGLGLDQGVDVAGSILATVALMLAIYGIVKVPEHGWGSAHTLGFLAAGAATFVAFLGLESRLANPIMPLRILRSRTLMESSAIRGCMAAALFGVFFLGALYLQHVRGFTPIETGLAFMPMSVVVAIMTMGPTAWLIRRFGSRPLIPAGLLISACSLVLLSLVDEHTSFFPGVVIPFMLFGFAGATFQPLLLVAISETPNEDAGLASGIVNVSFQTASAIGLAVFSTIAANHTKTLLEQGNGLASAQVDGYQLSYAVAAGLLAVGAIAALWMWLGARRRAR
jgi:EmrB/QacA subfamily drug resistance transporter